MPTYKNLSGRRLTIGGKEVLPNEVVETLIWMREFPSLVRIDNNPMYNPIVLSEVVEEDSIVKIPHFDKLGREITRYAIHQFVEKGEVEIRYNSDDNNPPLRLYPGGKWNIRCYERLINDIRVRFVGKIRLDVEEKRRMFIIVEMI